MFCVILNYISSCELSLSDVPRAVVDEIYREAIALQIGSKNLLCGFKSRL